MNLKWSIWLVNLEPVIGSEQGRTRPFLIISNEQINQLLPVVNGLPLTTKKSGRTIYPNEVLLPKNNFGLVKDTIVLAYQIRTIDKQRLIKQIGMVTDNSLQKEIVEAICFQLDIDLKP